MTTYSREFLTSSEVAAALRDLEDLPGVLRMERQVGALPWQNLGATSKRAATRYIKTFDRSLYPGRFRFSKSKD